MHYMTLPRINNLYFEVNIDNSYSERRCEDDWDAAYACDGNQQGVTYNFSVDGNTESSAFYKTEYGEIDETSYIPYEIDFSFDDWKERLIEAMADAYTKFWKEN